jgi:hypothetical protein
MEKQKKRIEIIVDDIDRENVFAELWSAYFEYY